MELCRPLQETECSVTSRALLQRAYGLLVQAGYDVAYGTDRNNVPEMFKRSIVNLNGFERQYFIRRLVGDAKRVLVVGDWWGCDSWSLKLEGKEVYALDIAPQRGVDRLVLGDVTRSLPFLEKSFDAVIIAEVLEHLIEDHVALMNLRRILRDDGALIVTVPFLHDLPEVHVRIYSPPTIRRLLEACGFQVKARVIRGGLVALDGPLFMLGHHGLNLLLCLLTKRTLYHWYLPWLADVDWCLGQKAGKWLRYSKYYGVYIRATKGNLRDFRTLNVHAFSTANSEFKEEKVATGD